MSDLTKWFCDTCREMAWSPIHTRNNRPACPQCGEPMLTRDESKHDDGSVWSLMNSLRRMQLDNVVHISELTGGRS